MNVLPFWFSEGSLTVNKFSAMLLVVSSERGREKEIIHPKHVLFVYMIYYKVLMIHSC